MTFRNEINDFLNAYSTVKGVKQKDRTGDQEDTKIKNQTDQFNQTLDLHNRQLADHTAEWRAKLAHATAITAPPDLSEATPVPSTGAIGFADGGHVDDYEDPGSINGLGRNADGSGSDRAPRRQGVDTRDLRADPGKGGKGGEAEKADDKHETAADIFAGWKRDGLNPLDAFLQNFKSTLGGEQQGAVQAPPQQTAPPPQAPPPTPRVSQPPPQRQAIPLPPPRPDFDGIGGGSPPPAAPPPAAPPPPGSPPPTSGSITADAEAGKPVTLTPDENAALNKAVNPDGRLLQSVATLRKWDQLYRFYAERGGRGDAQRAQAVMGALGRRMAADVSMYGQYALQAFKAGDMARVRAILERAGDEIPDGMDVKVSEGPNHTVFVNGIDKDGVTHEFGQFDVPNAARMIGMAAMNQVIAEATKLRGGGTGGRKNGQNGQMPPDADVAENGAVPTMKTPTGGNFDNRTTITRGALDTAAKDQFKGDWEKVPDQQKRDTLDIAANLANEVPGLTPNSALSFAKNLVEKGGGALIKVHGQNGYRFTSGRAEYNISQATGEAIIDAANHVRDEAKKATDKKKGEDERSARQTENLRGMRDAAVSAFTPQPDSPAMRSLSDAASNVRQGVGGAVDAVGGRLNAMRDWLKSRGVSDIGRPNPDTIQGLE